MIIRDTKDVYRVQVIQAVGENATKDDVLDYLFGPFSEAPFVIREWRDDSGERTPVQRLNMIWVIIFTLLCAPYQYIMNGAVGWDTKTKLGRFLLRVTGSLKET